MPKKKKINHFKNSKRPVLLVCLCLLTFVAIVITCIWWFSIYPYERDKEFFTQLKTDMSEVKLSLNAVTPVHGQWSEVNTCNRSYNNAAEGGWNCSVRLAVRYDKDDFNQELLDRYRKVVNQSSAFDSLNNAYMKEDFPSVLKEDGYFAETFKNIRTNKNCLLQFGVEKDEVQGSLNCLDAAREKWF